MRPGATSARSVGFRRSARSRHGRPLDFIQFFTARSNSSERRFAAPPCAGARARRHAVDLLAQALVRGGNRPHRDVIRAIGARVMASWDVKSPPWTACGQGSNSCGGSRTDSRRPGMIAGAVFALPEPVRGTLRGKVHACLVRTCWSRGLIERNREVTIGWPGAGSARAHPAVAGSSSVCRTTERRASDLRFATATNSASRIGYCWSTESGTRLVARPTPVVGADEVRIRRRRGVVSLPPAHLRWSSSSSFLRMGGRGRVRVQRGTRTSTIPHTPNGGEGGVDCPRIGGLPRRLRNRAALARRRSSKDPGHKPFSASPVAVL